MISPWVDNSNVALLTDLYQLTMLQAYWRERMNDQAVFSLFVRRLPERRNYLLACGLDDALHYLETLRFTSENLEQLTAVKELSDEFLGWLRDLRFEGDVYALPEGTPFFADEPLLEVEAPLPQAQLVESLVMNQMHLQTVLASKAARVVQAASGRPVVDFGLRRMQGADAALKAARAFYVAGVAATSNVLAGRVYDVPTSGTMAHSYIQAHDREADAFREFAALYPRTILLVDTYDTLAGVRNVVRLARELKGDFRVRGVRLDSGDLGELATQARRILDEAGLRNLEIFASGGLDEVIIARLLADGAPIDAFGVGTGMGVARDAPALDMAYKLTAYAGRGRLKLSPDKGIIPGRKQVFRLEDSYGTSRRDLIALHGERQPGRPLLVKVMEGGRRLPAGRTGLAAARERAQREIGRLPAAVRGLEPADYPVERSPRLLEYREKIAAATSRD